MRERRKGSMAGDFFSRKGGSLLGVWHPASGVVRCRGGGLRMGSPFAKAEAERWRHEGLLVGAFGGIIRFGGAERF
jgi:hypothetical protein